MDDRHTDGHTYIVGDVHIDANHQKDKIAYIPLNPVADYVYISDLILDSILAEKFYPIKFLN